MATIKFSEFDAGNINIGGAQLVGLTGGNSATNARFTAADLVNGLATITYVDSQDAGLQSQITQNTNDVLVLQGNVISLENDVANIVDLDEQTLSWDGPAGNLAISKGNFVILQEVLDNGSNIATLQGQVSVLQGNVVSIEAELANINTDNQTLTYDGANANLSISNGNSVVLQEVLDNAGNITIIQGQISDLQANGNIQTLSLDNSSNVLSISAGNSVDFTTVLGNVAGDVSQTLSWDTANANLSISGGNTVTLDGLGGGANIAVATASDGQDYLTTFDTSFFITADPTSTDTGYIAFGEAFNTNWNAGAYQLHGSGNGKGMFNGKTITNKVAAGATVFGIATANDIYLGTRYAALYTDNSYDVTLSATSLGHVALAINDVDKLVVDGATDKVIIETDLDVTGNIIATTGTVRLASLTTTERDTTLTAVDGDMIYNTTDSKLQGYQAGIWINLDGS